MKSHYTVPKRPQLVPILSQFNPNRILAFDFFQIGFNRIIPFKYRSLLSSFQVSSQKFCMHLSHLSCEIYYMFHLSQPWFGHLNYIVELGYRDLGCRDHVGCSVKYRLLQLNLYKTYLILSIYGSIALVDLGRFFSFLIYTQSVGVLEWQISRRKTTTCTQTSMPRVGFEPTIPVFERAKTDHALDGAATVIGTSSSTSLIKT
jgi:hypothetical protein